MKSQRRRDWAADLGVYATVNWGDGTTDNTQYPVQNDGTVDGTHDFAEAGNYAVRTTFYDTGGQEIAVVDSLATVADASLSASMTPGFASGILSEASSRRRSRHVHRQRHGHERRQATTQPPINWADGTKTAGEISYNSDTGQFIVSDNTDHTYLSAGTFDVTVTVYDEDGPPPPPAQATILTITAR